MSLRRRIVWENGVVEPGVRTHHALALKTCEPLLDVGRVLRPALLTIVDHVDAGVALPGDYFGNGFAHAGPEGRFVKFPLVLPLAQQFLERHGSGQAPGVRGQNSVCAAFHGFPFKSMYGLQRASCVTLVLACGRGGKRPQRHHPINVTHRAGSDSDKTCGRCPVWM